MTTRGRCLNLPIYTRRIDKPRWPEEFKAASLSMLPKANRLKVHVGVSGFSYPGWRGKFYPKEAKSEEFLSLYSGRLGSVEINSSFYAPPKVEVVAGWAKRTGAEFRFSFKAPKTITHVMKLGEGSADAALQFAKRLESLGPRAGPILFQLPPFSRVNHSLLEGFLSATSSIKEKVFEFRHESWLEDDTYDLLDKHGSGFCVAETEDMKPVFKVTGSLAYFRLRLESYDASAIDSWAPRIKKAMQDASEGYVYLRHDETGENAVLAERLAKELSGK